jgi:hypothetical protein
VALAWTRICTRAAFFILFVSQSALALVHGDKVQITLNPKLGPFTLESCQNKGSDKICKLKETSFTVNSIYLRKADASSKIMAKGDDDSSAVKIQVMGQ